MTLQVSIAPDSFTKIDSFFTEANASINPCSDKRCDNHSGQSYGCRLDSENTNCRYTDNRCTGYTHCD